MQAQNSNEKKCWSNQIRGNSLRTVKRNGLRNSGQEAFDAASSRRPSYAKPKTEAMAISHPQLGTKIAKLK